MLLRLIGLASAVTARARRADSTSEDGFSTAELIASAAIAVAAIAAIWAALQAMGISVMEWIQGQLTG